MTDPITRPALRVRDVIRVLDRHGVAWVLTGSAVLTAHGAAIVPNDLDVTPALDETNLLAVAAALRELAAVPAYVPEWPAGPSLDDCRRWRPTPATETNLDHLFVTNAGMVDIVPRLRGSYDDLIGEAVTATLDGIPVSVCSLADVLSRLDDRQRSKDVARRSAYEAVALAAQEATTSPDLALLARGPEAAADCVDRRRRR